MTKEQKAERRAKRVIRAWARKNKIREPLKYHHEAEEPTFVYDAWGDFLGRLYLDRGIFRTDWGRFEIKV